MTKQYIYEVEERSVDVRKFSIVSDRKLTEEEVKEAIHLPDISHAGSSAKEDGITATFLWTYYGNDSEIDVYGNLKRQD